MSGKPSLLVVELWALGDLCLAAPFLQAASEKYDVTLLARPVAAELQPRFFPKVRVLPFVMPWTAFRGKYQLGRWSGCGIQGLFSRLSGERFDLGVSARRDPRDHLLLWRSGARRRIGFPRLGSGWFLSDSLRLPASPHRSEGWRALGTALGLEIPAVVPVSRRGGVVLVHTGAAQPVKVWPLERYQVLIGRLREWGWRVEVACDVTQEEFWRARGEKPVVPADLRGLLECLDRAERFVGNDSGPGHLAALCGIPTFTIFGNQWSERFSPAHPAASWVEGKPCPHKPCYDRCRFDEPRCLTGVETGEVIARLDPWLGRPPARKEMA